MEHQRKIRITYEHMTKTYEEVATYIMECPYVAGYYLANECGKKNDNDHLQGLMILKEPYNDDTVRQYLRRYAYKYAKEGIKKGNGFYSYVKVVKEEKDKNYPVDYLCYVMKEDENPHNTIPEEDLEESRKRANQFKEKKVKKKKETLDKVCEHIDNKFRELLESQQNGRSLRNHYMYTIEDTITNLVLSYWKENRKRYNENQIVSIIQTVYFWNKEGESVLNKRIKDRAFREPLML